MERVRIQSEETKSFTFSDLYPRLGRSSTVPHSIMVTYTKPSIRLSFNLIYNLEAVSVLLKKFQKYWLISARLWCLKSYSWTLRFKKQVLYQSPIYCIDLLFNKLDPGIELFLEEFNSWSAQKFRCESIKKLNLLG